MEAALTRPPPRRSFVQHRLEQAGARFAIRDGALVAESFGDIAGEQAALAGMALVDLSPLPRFGVKGSGAAEWITGQGVVLPGINQAARCADGSLVARLGPNDILVLEDFAGNATLSRELPGRWDGDASPGARGFPVPRRDGLCWFLVAGKRAAESLAKLCAVDLREHKFERMQIAQTQVAGISAIVIGDQVGNAVACHLLADSASAEYLWDCLQDAMEEFSGRAVGLAALREYRA